jgi:uncharacterized protein with GYD domain
MTFFCHHVSFTSVAWSRILQSPDDRFAAIRVPIENLGGKFRASFFTTGRFDVLAITEFPDSITADDISAAFAQGGAVASIQTSPLLTPSQAIELHSRPSEPAYSSFPRKQSRAASAGS